MGEPVPEEPPIVTTPLAYKIAVAAGTGGSQYYVVSFRGRLGGQQLGVAVDVISTFAPDARLQFVLGAGYPDGLLSDKTLAIEFGPEGDDALLRRLAEAFEPQVPLTAISHVTQASLSFEVTAEVLNFEDTTPDFTWDQLIGKLKDVPGVNQAARLDGQLVLQVAGQFGERRRDLATDLEDVAGITVTFCSSPGSGSVVLYASPDMASRLFGSMARKHG